MIKVNGACDINFDGFSHNIPLLLRGLKRNADRLQSVYNYIWKGEEKDIIELEQLISTINWDYHNQTDYCGFCKAKQNHHKIILYTSDFDALSWLKKQIRDEQYQWEAKTRKVLDEEEEYYIIAFKYMDLTDYLAKTLRNFLKYKLEWLDDWDNMVLDGDYVKLEES